MARRGGERFKVVIVVMCVLGIAIGTGLLYISWSSPEIRSFEMYLSVADYVGVNADTSAIWFGTVPPSGTASRTVMLKNIDAWSRWVEMKAQGQLAGWVSVDANGFVLGPGEEKNVTVYVIVPKDAQHGNYTGRLDVVFRRVLFGPI